ncbi:MAG: GSCFA domain-containing protein [Chitinophagaceae bacterium]
MYDALFLNLKIAPLVIKIKENESIFLIGSCFSEHFARLLKNHHFSILHNPFGTLFNPESIEYAIIQSLQYTPLVEDDFVLVEDIWHHFNFHSQVSDINKQNLINNITSLQHQTHHFLEHTAWIFITYGTAWIYKRKDTQKIIANCHKQPSSLFEKQLLSTEDILSSFSRMYKSIKEKNKNIKFLLTISPVRHAQDGLIDNNLSKAQLISAVQQCIKQYEDVFYFPTYEYMIDVLRDYRFYENDKIHPNQLAINFIWKRFLDFAFLEDTQIYLNAIEKIYLATHHRPFHPESLTHKKFKQQVLEKCLLLEKKYPHLNLKEEKKIFS